MPDIFTKEKRSEVMSRIRSKNTKVELVVFKYLRAKKIYFQKHYARAAGSPDVAVPSRKVAVFIDGDFWHGRHAKERLPRLDAWWRAKIERNMRRDRRDRAALRKAGWSVLRVWEGELMRKRTRERWLEKVRAHLAAAEVAGKRWRVYVARCADGTLYTGIATDVRARLTRHNAGTGAKYTRGRAPVSLAWESGAMSGTEARRLEATIKRMTKPAKERYICKV